MLPINDDDIISSLDGHGTVTGDCFTTFLQSCVDLKCCKIRALLFVIDYVCNEVGEEYNMHGLSNPHMQII